jgi:S-adenosylmethionine uptake transporter
MDVIIKWLAPGFPLHEIVLIRTLVALALILCMVYLEGGFGLLKTKRIGLHSFRGVLIAIANMSYYLALAVMPIGEATAIFLTAPLIIVALSGPVLGEKVGQRRWIAILIGFVGVVLVSGVGTSAFQFAALLPLIGALAYALTQLMTRRLGVTETASVMSFYIGLVFVFISIGFWVAVGDGHMESQVGPGLTFLFRPWVMPKTDALLLMIICGILVAFFSYMLSQAYRIGEANVIAPFEYISLPMAVMWGYIFWGDVPGYEKIIGIVLIGGAGLYIFIREHIHSVRTDESASII